MGQAAAVRERRVGVQVHRQELLAAARDHEKCKAKGLFIAAFPCNQFGKQEPGGPEEIKKFVQEETKFHPDLYEKIDVNEANAHPLYSFQKSSRGVDNIKFLVDKDGRPVKAYRPDTDPKEVEADIEKLL